MVQLNQESETFVAECRNVLELVDGRILSSSLVKMLNFRVFSLQRLEKLEAELSNLLPIKRIKAHYITMDGFWGICRDCNFIECGLYDETFGEMVMDHWNSIFDLKSTKSKTFTGTIDTDGTSINIHYTRPKSKKMVDTDGSSNKVNLDMNIIQLSECNIRERLTIGLLLSTKQ